MDEIEKITLDLTDCKYIRDFHERIRVAFDFPEWYGRNLDASGHAKNFAYKLYKSRCR